VEETERGLRLRWDAGRGAVVEVDVELGAELLLWPRVVIGDGVLPPESLCYPILTGLQRLEGDDRLLFPLHSGRLVSNPLATPGLAGSYPDGFAGCSLQATAYYAEDVGGFYLATHDPASTHKGFAFRPDEWCVWHDHWDLRPGSSMDLGYPVVLGALTDGDWYEAADRYRAWATAEAPWCAAGPRHESARARWLHDEVGLVIWCAPSSIDWSPWYRDYAAAAGTPVHIVPGWDWPAELPPTTDRWFPARFDPANVEAWHGHRVTPYLNDLFVSARDLDEWEPELAQPYVGFFWSHFFSGPGPSPGVTGDPTVVTSVDYAPCPASERFATLHEARDVRLVSEYGADGVCYDISSGNPPPRCVRESHDHPPGWGRHLFDAYNALQRRTHEATLGATGRSPAVGTEVVNESVMGTLDFYTARACSGPFSGLEAGVGGPELEPGSGRDLVPLFEAVYHDYGPVRQDGWAQVSQRQGDLFFWTSARCVLQWGGLLSLHYAINWPGPGHGRDEAAFVGWDGGTYSSSELPEDDPAKLDFIGELAAARVGFANKYLGWGRLRRPPRVGGGTVTLGYEFVGEWLSAHRAAGAWTVPRVVVGAWEAPDGDVGVLLCNVGPDAIELDVSGMWGTRATTRDGVLRLGPSLVLPSRRVVLVD
jgi:hypothetical protein